MVSDLIVPLDQSTLAESALPLARTLVRRWQVPVTLVGVPDLPGGFRGVEGQPQSEQPVSEGMFDAGQQLPNYGYPTQSWPGGPSPEDVDDLGNATAEYERYFATVADSFHDATVVSLVRPGDPAERILEVAADREEPVIVMASHGRTGLQRTVVGSVTFQVVQQAPCPVFVIRGSDTAPTEQADIPLETILVPLDGSALSEQALVAVERMFGSTAERIRLVRMVEIESEEEVSAYLEQTANRLSNDLGLPVTWEVGEGNVAQEITRLAGEAEANLIAMATSGRSGFKRLVLGSVAERTLHESTRPLMLVRPREEESSS